MIQNYSMRFSSGIIAAIFFSIFFHSLAIESGAKPPAARKPAMLPGKALIRYKSNASALKSIGIVLNQDFTIERPLLSRLQSVRTRPGIAGQCRNR
jgi:hypothetical protein